MRDQKRTDSDTLAFIGDAIVRENIREAQLLLKGNAKRLKDEDGKGVIFFCLKGNNHKILERLIMLGIPLDADNSGWTPLHEVAIIGDTQAANILLEYGADIDAQDHAGITPLHAAVCWGQEAMVGYLLKEGANTEIVDSLKSTALISATCQKGNYAMIELLLQHNASVDVCYVGGITTIRHHILKGKDETLKALLKQYAPPKKRKR